MISFFFGLAPTPEPFWLFGFEEKFALIYAHWRYCLRDFVSSLQSAGSPTNIRKTKLLKFLLDATGPLPYNKMGNDTTNMTN